MAKRSSRRGRPGKARASKRGGRAHGAPGAAVAAAAGAPDASAGKPSGDRAGAKQRAGRTGPASRSGRAASRLGEQAALGERPRAPWHPLPLSELLIFVGLVGVVVGASRGESGLPVVAAGIGAICVGTFDFTIREHLSGYRPHTTLLAAAPTALLHGGIAIAMLAAHAPSPSWIVAPLVVDAPVFWVLYRVLRARYRDARRERVFAASR